MDDLKNEMENMQVTSPIDKKEVVGQDHLCIYHPPTPIPQSKTDAPSPAIVISSVHLKVPSRRSFKEHFISTSY